MNFAVLAKGVRNLGGVKVIQPVDNVAGSMEKR